jgi:AraC family transcriptional regulator
MRTETFAKGELILKKYRPHLQMPMHAHDSSKIGILLSGSVIEEHNKGDRLCRAGDILIKPAGANHCDSVGPTGLSVLSMRFQSDRDVCKSVFSAYRRLPLEPFVARIVRHYLDGDSMPDETIEELVCQLASIDRHAKDQPHWSHQAIEILKASYTAPPSLTSLAAEIGAHPVSLAQALRRKTGKTKTEIVHQLRIQHSLLMLQEGHKVSSTAVELGFSDQSHFCRVFKRWMGCSPQEYQLRFIQND